MSKYCQLILGPAGSGKSTYCNTINNFYSENNYKRSFHILNLDPAAEHLEYTPSIDIRDLITLTDVMEELNYGPNGGLIYCLEYLLKNKDWLQDQIGDYDEDYLLIDCPGQIELTMHTNILKTIADLLSNEMGYKICAIYLMECSFLLDESKYFAGVLSSLASMIQLEIPYISVITKTDLLNGTEDIDRYLDNKINVI